MRILVNRKPKLDTPWGGGNNFVAAFCDMMTSHGHHIVFDLCDMPDAVMLVDPRYDELGISINEVSSYKHENPYVRVVHRVNECDARKGTEGIDSMLRIASSATDATVFVSNWLRDYHLAKDWKCQDTHVIENGVDASVFKPRVVETDIVKIAVHHWSSNVMKGADVYEFIDDFVAKHPYEYSFTYIGRTESRLKNTRVIPPLFGRELGRELANHSVYITGTRFDPAPNHVLESISCGLPTYAHENGGGAVEFAGEDHTFEDVDELEKLLLGKSFKKNDKRLHSWEECIASYERLFMR